MTRTRRNVSSLNDGGETLRWYAQAVRALWTRPLNDPTSWRYMGAVHGVPPAGGDPFAVAGESVPGFDDRRRFWDQCQHQTWYFLPWHRGYVAAFEAIVAAEIEAQGGPADWGLPYWDYSGDARSRMMPAAFCDEFIGGQHNPLWMQWGRTADGDMGLSDSDVSLDCLQSKFFSGTSTGGEVGFAGPVTDWVHFGGLVGHPNGRVEEGPHNWLHSQIGGLMGDPRYAALDPIFWLHHCNIDRLWEVWRRTKPELADPTDQDWLTGETFEVHFTDGSVWAFQPGDLLDTAAILDGYEYDVLPPAVDALGGVLGMPEKASMETALAGASDGPVSLTGGSGHATITIPNEVQSLSVLGDSRRVYLNLENIKGQGDSANYQIYVNNKGAQDEPVLAGQMSLFGLESASDPETGHGGSGLNKVIEISDLADRLALASPEPAELEVTFERRSPASPPPFEQAQVPQVEIGRISIFYGSDPEE